MVDDLLDRGWRQVARRDDMTQPLRDPGSRVRFAGVLGDMTVVRGPGSETGAAREGPPVAARADDGQVGVPGGDLCACAGCLMHHARCPARGGSPRQGSASVDDDLREGMEQWRARVEEARRADGNGWAPGWAGGSVGEGGVGAGSDVGP